MCFLASNKNNNIIVNAIKFDEVITNIIHKIYLPMFIQYNASVVRSLIGAK